MREVYISEMGAHDAAQAMVNKGVLRGYRVKPTMTIDPDTRHVIQGYVIVPSNW